MDTQRAALLSSQVRIQSLEADLETSRTHVRALEDQLGSHDYMKDVLNLYSASSDGPLRIAQLLIQRAEAMRARVVRPHPELSDLLSI